MNTKNQNNSLFEEWVRLKRPLMHRDNDFDELDYTDMQSFAFWAENKINQRDSEILEILEGVYNLEYRPYPEGESPDDYPVRVLRGQGFSNAIKVVTNFLNGK